MEVDNTLHYKILMPIILAVQLGIFLFSGVLLLKRRAFYPIKQLSPVLTFLTSASIIVISSILAVCRLTDIHQKNGAALATCNVLYVFFREFIILSFYMRCLRICAAYWKTKSKLIFTIFSREFRIALMTALISCVPSLIQVIEYISTHDVNEMTYFFPFYYTVGYELKPLGFLPLWFLDNLLFFFVLVMSLKVHYRFKFIKSLVGACLLFHIEQWINVIGVLATNDGQETRKYFEYYVMGIHTVFLWILLTPSLRPNEYQHPLPLEGILISHSMALLDKQTYAIIDEFSQYLTDRSVTDESRRREASTWLQVYATFRVTQRKIILLQMKQVDHLEQQSRQLLREFVCLQIIPNTLIQMIRDSVSEIFNEGEFMDQDSIRDDLLIQHFRRLDRRLNDAISHIFREWRKTYSFEAMKEKLKQNGHIIMAMTKLKIGI